MAVSVMGVGATGVGRYGDVSAIELARRAVDAALDDAGVERSEIDGLISHIGHPRGVDYDLVASRLALTVDFSAQPWSHGRFGSTVLQHAAMAITCGLAKTVLCVAAYRNTPIGVIGARTAPGFGEALRDGGGPHGETPYAGFIGPLAGAGMALQRYLHVYGVERDKLNGVPLALRRHANLNPTAAMFAKKLSMDDCDSAPFIVEPLKRIDCSVVVDGAVAIILTSDARADDGPNPAVRIAAMQGVAAGPANYIFGERGLGINEVSDDPLKPFDRPAVFRSAFGPKDVDLVEIYDAFSPLVLFTLERFGFCARGEAADWIQGGRIQLGGELPVNTGGGMLSDGHLNGWNQFHEIVVQLRRAGGERQVRDASIAQWATAVGDSIIFTRPGVEEGR